MGRGGTLHLINGTEKIRTQCPFEQSRPTDETHHGDFIPSLPSLVIWNSCLRIDDDRTGRVDIVFEEMPQLDHEPPCDGDDSDSS